MGQVMQLNGIRPDPVGDFQVGVDDGPLRPVRPALGESATGNAEGTALRSVSKTTRPSI